MCTVKVKQQIKNLKLKLHKQTCREVHKQFIKEIYSLYKIMKIFIKYKNMKFKISR